MAGASWQGEPEIIDPYSGWKSRTERVLILHDLFDTPLATATLASAFRDAGYKIDNTGYNPLRTRYETILPHMLGDVQARAQEYNDDVLHVVCHASGCVLAHALIAKHRPAKLGRVLMLVAPWQASYLQQADAGYLTTLMQDHRLDGANRVLLQELLATTHTYAAGVLTGKRMIYAQQTQTLFADRPDRTAHLPSVQAPAPLRVADADQHSLITDPAVLQQAVYFIENGQFPAADSKN